MLTVDEIKMFIDEDAASVKKHFARIGERYYDGDHDIKNYRMFYFNQDGQLVEDTSRANVRIPHPFFKELTEQGTQYTLSGSDGFVFSDDPALQSELDSRFNNNDDFVDELSEAITDCQTKGFAYMYAMKDSKDQLKFICADSIGVVEVEARFAEDGKDHVIYWYVDRVDKEGHRIKKIMDWDDEQVVYYVQDENGEIEKDTLVKVNPRPHILYQVDGDDNTYFESLGFLPFFRLDNNKKQFSNLKAVKDLIDDYDLMASSLSNNLIDFDHPLYAVKGFEGDNLDELQQNLKTKKIVGVSDTGGIEVHTVDVPYEARKVKLELDEKNIYRFGMGLNLSGLKDTSATTNAVYNTYLFGEGAFLSCDKKNYENQYTTNYDPETSAGTDKFYTKQGKVLHPNGLSLAVDNIAKESPTYAELGKSANYSLKFNTKNVKMGLIKSKVGTAVV